MPKPVRLLKFLQLLSHRRVVSFETIKSVCGIPDRTVYRYLNAISEANIPVFYDRERGGYCLTAPVDMHLDDLTLQEVVLLITSLRLVQEHVNPAYRSELNQLIERLLSRQPFPVDSIAGDSNSNHPAEQAEPDFSQELSLALAQAAISEGKKLTLYLESADADGRTHLQIDEPGLSFDRNWGITGADTGSVAVAHLDEITQVVIK
jgi:predicted DNA-binding transcriptional regulator YafY